MGTRSSNTLRLCAVVLLAAAAAQLGAAQAPALGPPRGCVCPMRMEEVCGADGTTYTHPCAAECYKVKVVSQGACKPGATSAAGAPPATPAPVSKPAQTPDTAKAGPLSVTSPTALQQPKVVPVDPADCRCPRVSARG
jgi:hypothetical protein